MNLALVTLFFGMVVNFLSVIFAKYYLDIDAFNSYRFIVNTATNLTPLLCFGIDVAMPAQPHSKKSHLISRIIDIYWHLSIIWIVLTILFHWRSPQSSAGHYTASLAIGLLLAAIVLLNNYLRSEQKIDHYFMYSNLWDKIYRFLITVVTVMVFEFTFLWAVLYWLLLFVFLRHRGTSVFRSQKNEVGLGEVSSYILRSSSYLIPTAIAILITRYVYYVYYYTSPQSTIVVVDFCIMFGLLFLIPSLNSSKISEAKGSTSIAKYVTSYVDNQKKISYQEYCISFGTYIGVVFALIEDLVTTSQLLSVGFGIYGGFIIYSVFPNTPYLLLLMNDRTNFFQYIASLFVCTILLVCLSSQWGLSASGSFVIGALLYIVVSFFFCLKSGCVDSRLFRFRQAVINMSVLIALSLALKAY